MVVVREGLGVATPAHRRIQRLLGGLRRHMILQLVEEAALRRRVALPLVQHAPDVGGQRDVRQEVALEERFALVQWGGGEALARLGESDVAAFNLGEASI